MSHDMAELRSSYSFETEGKSTRMDEMKKTGQAPMEVNAMTDVLMLNESDKEESYGDVNAMQYGEHCFLRKKTGHLKRNCREFEEWRRKNSNWKNRSTNRLEIQAIGNSPVIIVAKTEICCRIAK